MGLEQINRTEMVRNGTSEMGMIHNTDDLRIKEIKELLPPGHVIREFPATETAATTVFHARESIHRILHGADACSRRRSLQHQNVSRGPAQMTLQSRDRRALAMLAVSGVLTLGWWLSTSDDKSTEVVAAADSVPMAEKRLVKLRQTAAALPGREEALKKVQLELGSRERGMLRADTAQQAQAQLMQILTKIGRAQQPPIGIRASEIGQIKSLGDDYGEVAVSVSFDCRVEQLVNLLADITAQKELIATSELRIGNAHPKEKVMPVRLTVSGVVPRKLIPDRKGVTQF